MEVTRDGEVLDAPRARAGTRPRARWIRGERVTIPDRPAGQPRRLVWPLVERIYRSLCNERGFAYAQDETVRAMVWQDYGHVLGARSIARARRREKRRGTIMSERIRPGRMAGKKRTESGTNKVRFPDVTAKREARWREKTEARQRRAAARREELATRKREAVRREKETAREAQRRARAEDLVRVPLPAVAREALIDVFEGKQVRGAPSSERGEVQRPAADGVELAVQPGEQPSLEEPQEPLAGQEPSVPAIVRSHLTLDEQRRELAKLGADWSRDETPPGARSQRDEPPDE